MDYKELKAVLAKYLEGNSSIEEEKKLRNYFLQQEDIPAEFQYAKDLFTHYHKESTENFEDAKIRYLRKTRQRNIRMTAVAAGILLLAGLFAIFLKPRRNVAYAYINGKPVTDKNIAMEETKKALFLVSENLNQGTEQLYHLSKFKETERLISKDK